MKIRTWVIVTIVTIIVVFVSIVPLAMQVSLYPAVGDIEDNEAENAVLQVVRLIENDLKMLGGTCEDWGKWDDTYLFVTGEKEGYPKENLINETFLDLQIDLMVFYDTNGTILYGKGFDHSQLVALPVPEELVHVPAYPRGAADSAECGVPPLSGVIGTTSAPLLASIGPILRSDRSGPTAGYILVGRYLDDDEIARYTSLTMSNLTIKRPGMGDGPGFALEQVSYDAIPMTIRVSDDGEALIVESTIDDIHGSPAFVACLNIERTAFRLARDSIVLLLALVVLGGGAIGTAAVLFLDRRVLSRVSSLEKSVKEIAERKDFKRRTILQGDDEIASLSRSIDTMLDALDRHIAAESAAKDDASIANAKLTLLSSITRHDVLNQVAVVRGFADLLGESIPPGSADLMYLDRIRAAAKAIENQLAFMRDYDLEAAPPSMEWIDVRKLFLEVAMGMGLFGVKVEVLFEGLLLYSDRLLAKIFSTLIDNSVSHGERVDRITLSFHEAGGRGVLVYEDNGIGIPPDQKELIFERGVGKNLGLGLYLARGLLSVYNIEIRETGEHGKGARFEILIPRDAYRWRTGDGNASSPP